MAADTQGSFLVYARDAVEDAAAARRVGVPRIARRQDVIEGGAHGDVRVAIRRRVVNAGAQLVSGMAGAHGNVVSALLLEDARSELVAFERLHLMRQRHGILAFEILLGLAVRQAVDGNVHRDLVAIHQFDLEEDQLGRIGVEFEPVPVGIRAHVG